MTYRVRNIGIAVALAVLAALLTSFYVANYKRHVQQGEDHVTVLVAKQDIQPGTAGSDAMHMLATEQVPRRSVVPGAISKPAELQNLVASQPIFAGEQVTTRRFSSPTQVGMPAQLSGTARAFDVEGDQYQLLAGTLKDGDHVDFVAALKQPGSQDFYFSRVVVRDVKVLKAPDAPAAGGKLTNTSGGNFAVLLALTDNQAQKIQYVLANTGSDANRWHLQLRPVTHAADSADHLDSFDTVLNDGIPLNRRR
jgi:Flp pilus assembly protein CpaB